MAQEKKEAQPDHWADRILDELQRAHHAAQKSDMTHQEIHAVGIYLQRRYITWREVLNPLRYEICVGAGPGRYWHWNDDAWLWVAWRNFLFRVKTGCWLRGHEWVPNRYSDGDRCDRCFKQRGQ